jgi:hypothetical protein
MVHSRSLGAAYIPLIIIIIIIHDPGTLEPLRRNCWPQGLSGWSPGMSVMGTWGRFSGSRTPISISRIGRGCQGDIVIIIIIIVVVAGPRASRGGVPG